MVARVGTLHVNAGDLESAGVENGAPNGVTTVGLKSDSALLHQGQGHALAQHSRLSKMLQS